MIVLYKFVPYSSGSNVLVNTRCFTFNGIAADAQYSQVYQTNETTLVFFP